MGAKCELGRNIIYDPKRVDHARQWELLDHYDWYVEGICELKSNPHEALSEEALRFQSGILKARKNELRDQIIGLSFPEREYKPRVPLDAESARRKDLLLHRKALSAGIEKAKQEGEGEDKEELTTRLDELQEEIELFFSRDLMYNNRG